jgi:protein-tyrosine phosphatase
MLNKQMLEEFDLVLVMEEGHKESIQVEFPFARHKVHLLSMFAEGISYDVPDPAGAGDEAREIILDLVTMVGAGYEKICRIAEASPGAV